MTSSLEKTLNIDDIYLYINNFTDIKSKRNLSLTSKTCYNIYKNNKIYIDKQNINNILKHFHLSNDIFIKPLNRLSLDELSIVNTQLNNIYNHFRKKKYTPIADFLNHIIDKEIDTNKQRNTKTTFLFETLISLCSFNYNIRNPASVYTLNIDSFINEEQAFVSDGLTYCYSVRFILSSQDCQYILKYSNLKNFDIILNWIKLPPGLLSFVFKDLLYNEQILRNTDKKAVKIIDYFLREYCSFDFTENSSMYFDAILNETISKNKTSLFMYILKMKQEYGFALNYQSLINKCIDCLNLRILKLIISVIKDDNKINKVQISISPELIYKICEKGAFELLEYIVSNMLGRMINLTKYMSFLCDGISSFYINNKDKFNNENKDQCINILWLYNYLSLENQQFLKSHLLFIK